MAAAREQAGERRLERGRLEEERRDVAVQVVDRHEREPAGPREGLRRRKTDEQRADQPGAGSDRDGVDVAEGRSRLVQRVPDHRCDELEVPA